MDPVKAEQGEKGGWKAELPSGEAHPYFSVLLQGECETEVSTGSTVLSWVIKPW